MGVLSVKFCKGELMKESPDTIHGRMKESAHIAGYTFTRAMENMRFLLEDKRYEQLSAGHNINQFLRDTKDAFKLLKIDPEERKQIAELVKELQPEASQRAIADMVGVSAKTIGADLGVEYSTKKPEKQPGNVEYSTPALPPDDYDIVGEAGKKMAKEERKTELKKEREELAQDFTDLPEDDRYNIFQADVNTVELEHQFDFIITDPPYLKEHLHLYETLAKRAKEWLKPTGLLVAMCGQSYFNQIMKSMTKHLDYYWLSAYMLPGQPTSLRQRQVNCSWKPLLVLGNSAYKGKIFGDVYVSENPDDGKTFIDGKEISRDELIKFLRFEVQDE